MYRVMESAQQRATALAEFAKQLDIIEKVI